MKKLGQQQYSSLKTIIIIITGHFCILLFSITNELAALYRFEKACCQWALQSAHITGLVTTLLFKLTVQKYIDPSVSKVHAGSFRLSVIHGTLTGATGHLGTESVSNTYFN